MGDSLSCLSSFAGKIQYSQIYLTWPPCLPKLLVYIFRKCVMVRKRSNKKAKTRAKRQKNGKILVILGYFLGKYSLYVRIRLEQHAAKKIVFL